ncbi:MAG: hypothetical protein WKG01_06675 [Kofleriaceae bacterium]
MHGQTGIQGIRQEAATETAASETAAITSRFGSVATPLTPIGVVRPSGFIVPRKRSSHDLVSFWHYLAHWGAAYVDRRRSTTRDFAQRVLHPDEEQLESERKLVLDWRCRCSTSNTRLSTPLLPAHRSQPCWFELHLTEDAIDDVRDQRRSIANVAIKYGRPGLEPLRERAHR